MRTVDLAIYADTLAGEHAALAARLEQAHARLREAAIERDARAHLPGETVRELEVARRSSAGSTSARRAARSTGSARALDAVEQLQCGSRAGWSSARRERDEEAAV